MERHPVTLKANSAYQIGWVWEDDQGLWRVNMIRDPELLRAGVHLDCYTAGPFGTQEDAEMEVHDVWSRAANMRWKPRGR